MSSELRELSKIWVLFKVSNCECNVSIIKALWIEKPSMDRIIELIYGSGPFIKDKDVMNKLASIYKTGQREWLQGAGLYSLKKVKQDTEI